ncbi:SgcJ/EcaC family oxidoreductase [Metapseudomonas lalkuanensis]|uniref:SgcJ/EcaC family oxidoreductase n=1 Tax=Metapseudomonas lalkuanensis TaxID=2604832 RepID=A0A5J6QNE9_9GAMM|nr:SgcJ/EcaC family oxidoreductase [Pseudomonas lalkuanensis]QEY63222.1 SgcJ/EcaC family oxidoreductase [Pseudomonas lalkuanensis]
MKNSIIAPAALALVLAGCTSYSSTSGTGSTEQCKATSEQEISALFDRWNRSLQTGDPRKVVANYAERSVLLPTLSNKPRTTPSEKEDYFQHFLENKPVGKIDWRMIEIDCNSAVDAGLYTFTFGASGPQVKARYTYTYKWDGQQWLITSHHSSAMPEKN